MVFSFIYTQIVLKLFKFIVLQSVTHKLFTLDSQKLSLWSYITPSLVAVIIFNQSW